VSDLLFVAIVVLFFTLAAALVSALDRYVVGRHAAGPADSARCEPAPASARAREHLR